jgi:hypothetical protein
VDNATLPTYALTSWKVHCQMRRMVNPESADQELHAAKLKGLTYR